MREEDWKQKRVYTSEQMETARQALEAIRYGLDVRTALRRFPLPDGFLAKHTLVAMYRQLVEIGEWDEDPELLARIRMKPVRTLSGVTTITVLTKPSPCPGKCIFCPTEADMPQSYLADEPGAKRGVENAFDPYRQVSSRLQALHDVGHPTDKIELLILGGSWSAYPRGYQEWFVRRCFDALNGVNSEDNDPLLDLVQAHGLNVNGEHRNVGLVVETRPDLITAEELKWYRRLGVTKVQMGIQSLDDHILEINRRGHTVEQALQASILLRAGGFKTVMHWMPNLLGATLQSDKEDFARLWEPDGFNPDELKIYPCQLLRNSELFDYWQRGEYHPYSEEDLISLIANLKTSIPPYCRVNRIIRDIPSQHVVAGNRNTSLRQNVVQAMQEQGTQCQCIRCREIKNKIVDYNDLQFHDLTYRAANAEEHFLSNDTPDDGLAGYCRLSLPDRNNILGIPELETAAIIREVHVYGQSLEVGTEKKGAAQHIGIGSRLITHAEKISKVRGFARLAVIAAVGTRGYYAARGFEPGELYMVKNI
jgi:elongator complex protein 3